MTLLKRLLSGKPKPPVPCPDKGRPHTFYGEWEFCTTCGIYKSDIPKADGGYR